MQVVVPVAFSIIGVLFTAASLLSVYRIVRGPSILDRMIASDVLLTTLILVVGAEMVYNQHTRTIPVMLVLAATAVFATVAVARYVSRQDLSTADEVVAELPTENVAAGDETPTGSVEAAAGSSTAADSSTSSSSASSSSASTGEASR